MRRLNCLNLINEWLTSFLWQRKQRVKIGSVKSKFTTINPGVPQGTIFGPIGFVHHLNDMRTTCDHVRYVDDCRIWESYAPSFVEISLQTAADEVVQWTTTNNMALNNDKIKEMRICFKKETPHIPPITINNIQIEKVRSTRLLGVTISQDLTWQLHIDDITTRASQRLCFIILLKRDGKERHHLFKIYITIISSVIEYACQVWHTSLKIRQTNLLESIQKRAMCITFCGMRYNDGIATARMPTLADRREALCRSLFATMQQTNHKLHHLLPPPRTCNYSLRNARAYGEKKFK